MKILDLPKGWGIWGGMSHAASLTEGRGTQSSLRAENGVVGNVAADLLLEDFLTSMQNIGNIGISADRSSPASQVMEKRGHWAAGR